MAKRERDRNGYTSVNRVYGHRAIPWLADLFGVEPEGGALWNTCSHPGQCAGRQGVSDWGQPDIPREHFRV